MKEFAIVAEKSRVEADVQATRLAIRLRKRRVPKGTKVQDAPKVLTMVLEKRGGGEG